ncbi:MAG TPA: hypothetical protein VGM73_00440 [Candidatus Didemnitutus sp.]|jgi:hypothetical protein
MKVSRFYRFCIAATLCGLALPLVAQTSAGTTAAAPISTASVLQALDDARQFRADLVSSIVAGNESADTALARLKTQASASGLAVTPDADLGFAAIDMGQRLLLVRRSVEAMKFFQTAESALAGLVQKTSDTQAWDKTQYLQQLAFVRSRYLGEATQAKADLDRAIALRPDDSYLIQLRTLLASEHGGLFSRGVSSGPNAP